MENKFPNFQRQQGAKGPLLCGLRKSPRFGGSGGLRLLVSRGRVPDALPFCRLSISKASSTDKGRIQAFQCLWPLPGHWSM